MGFLFLLFVSATLLGCFSVFDDIRELSSCFRRCRSVFWSLRWHLRFAFSLASALCLRASSVAPVRGGTYFSLPPQRKVGKRKRLTPPILVLA
jgi:hypothetical protein